ncbi:4Fe-4S ferredoxin [filamentous cyanobacterium LEGE 11480]|uniref:4Fe-4S ferredoxin n=1 Tax=Romeriopsis navalis LEGE 11480 TaxID=2777977 RepID=A0A928VSC4_9CYAN|nr:LdpA C-terminal domain-containing domain [Romeriopsis navalis]MBE9031660.1 4Fe-4S ferredoxin [Romeriopsis navalis LEGE 11480]
MNPMQPLQSLQSGHWFKLICGASYQHIPAIRNLTIAYTLAGADCIDVAADPAIIAATRSAIAEAQALIEPAQTRGFHPNPTPWLMVSLNDGEDPHFRKAEFNPDRCPTDCPRPCERICPADAIVFNPDYAGVVDALCYGCGRCLNICPIDQITARSYIYAPEIVAPMVLQAGVDAIEIHTQIGRLADFTRLWQAIQPHITQLKLLAISCPDGNGLENYLRSLNQLIQPLDCQLLWQTDGRPMSGDIGSGTSRACLRLGQKVLNFDLPGFVQLAGGTNDSTVAKAQTIGLTKAPQFAGIAYGSYARSRLHPILQKLEPQFQPEFANLKEESYSSHSIQGSPTVRNTSPPAHGELLWQAVALAHELVSQIKSTGHSESVTQENLTPIPANSPTSP